VKTRLCLLIAVALIGACSDDSPPPEEAAPPPAAQQQQQQQQQQQAATEKADVAAAEVTEPAADPCDLSGFDMSKMTVSQHEQMVKLCNDSKQ
jgi:hypothetical protein